MSNQSFLHVGKGLDDEWRLQSLDDNNEPVPIAHSTSTEAMYTLSSPSMLVATPNEELLEREKDYLLEPVVSDAKNSIYTSDDFRMFSFKVRPCSRAYSHDWTECPCAHTGENARRRDPREFHYSCVLCPDFFKGACRFGMHVSMHMLYLRAGYILHSIAPVCAKMALIACDGCVSLHTLRMS